MISIIATIYNEERTLEPFLAALLAQTLPADEIVIADGGSTDCTPEVLQRFAAAHPVVRPLLLPRSNRSVGRNRAIEAAGGEIVAATDAGSRADPDWLERITAPLRADPEVDVVTGYFRALGSGALQQAISAATIVPVGLINPETFLGSSRSLAFRKTAWERAGGYPEWMETSEDTEFAVALRHAGCRCAFAPDALVSWELPSSLRRLYRTFYEYARCDAQAGLFFRHYYKNYVIPAGVATFAAGAWWPPLRWLAGLAIAAYLGKQCLRAARRTHSLGAVALTPAVAATLDLAHLFGYARGRLERPAIARRRKGSSPEE